MELYHMIVLSCHNTEWFFKIIFLRNIGLEEIKGREKQGKWENKCAETNEGKLVGVKVNCYYELVT